MSQTTNKRFILFILLCWTGCSITFSQIQRSLPPQEEAAIEILQIGNEILRTNDRETSRSHISFHSFDYQAGEEIKLKVWEPTEPFKAIYLLIHDINANIWYRSSQAKKISEGIWMIHNVRFGKGQFQGQRFTLKAVIASKHLPEIQLITEEWETQALAISAPAYVEIKERLLKGDRSLGKVNQDQIWISTLNNRTVSAVTPTLVQSIATINGTFVSSENHSGINFIYVLVPAPGHQRFRVLGPAKIDRTRWTIPEAFLQDPYRWNPESTNLIAVISDKPIVNSIVEKPNWSEDFKAVSDPVKVGLKPLKPVMRTKPIEINISHAIKLNGSKIECCDHAITDTLENIISLSGDIKNLPEETSIWTIVNPVGTDIWEVYGRALVQLPHWNIDMIHPRRLAKYTTNVFQVKAVVTHENLNPGIIYTEDWKNKTFSESASFLIHNKQTNYLSDKEDVSITISELGGKNARKLMTKVNLQDNSQSYGKVMGVVEDMSVWVGVRLPGESIWNFTGPARIENGNWHLSGMQFFESGNGKESLAIPKYDIIAIVTLGILPLREITVKQLQDYAMATSSISKIRGDPGLSLQNLKYDFISSKMLNIMLPVFLLLLLSVLFEYFFRLVSKTARDISGYLNNLSDYMKDQFPNISKPEMKSSVLGLGIFTLGIFAIVQYFPIYTHAIKSVLGMTSQKSAALALLMIIFTGLAGVLIHLSIEDGRSEKEKNNITSAQVIIILITGCLWCVQTLIYYKLYLKLVPIGELLIPVAMGIAAFFIAAMETLGFYWAVKLGMTAIAWLCYHMLLYGPPKIGCSVMKIIEQIFQSIPSRLDSIKE